VGTAAHERLAIGQTIGGRYRIERELGEGGMGVVYLVSDQQVVGEIFAVKVLKEALDPQALQLLREEVRQTRKLSHPNILDMHSVNVDGKRLYVLMEYLEGKTLNTLLDEEFGRGMPFSHAWPIIEDVGAALGYAHDHNVIHSDLKPANVLLTTSGKTKLLDFGIARISRGPLLHKRSGSRALTPAYASCEMLKGEQADPRDDIYSFACVIYEMLSGDRPFGELNALEARDVGTRLPPLAVLSQAQNEALAQALAFDRESRTASVEQLLAGLATGKAPRGRQNSVLRVAIAAAAALSLTYFAVDKLWVSKRSVAVQTVAPDTQQAASRATTGVFNPPPHSIAVLPFVNMSGDKEQDYFSDGLSEELLNDLSRIDELQVAARTSAFSFKGKDTDINTIGRKLNVGAVLEGSVRRSGKTVRITTQLINAVTGFHTWSQTYDRDLTDMLKLQTEIADAVVKALKVNLLGDITAKVEVGGTRNPAAFDAYLRGWKAFYGGIVYEASDREGKQAASKFFSEAIRVDPAYALAYMARSWSYSVYGTQYATTASIRDGFLNRALADARKSVELAPDLGEGYGALGGVLEDRLEFESARKAFDSSRALAGGSARVWRSYSEFHAAMGFADEAVTAARRAVTLDALNALSYCRLGDTFLTVHRYHEALGAYDECEALSATNASVPGTSWPAANRRLVLYVMGDYSAALASCEAGDRASPITQACLAVVYNRLGRKGEAKAELEKLKAAEGEAGAYDYAQIYAQWGEKAEALGWLEAALKMRQPDLRFVRQDLLLNPLRKEPRFQAIERALKFPEKQD
jgi:serine/threonine-protein kinase